MNLAAGIKELVSKKGISEELILDTVKDVLTKAYTKFKGINDIKVVSELDKNLLNVFLIKEVVKKPTDLNNQISFKDYNKTVKTDEEKISEPTKIEILSEPIKDFIEKEIVWISENILNRIKNIEKDIIKYEYVKKKDKLVSGVIIKKDNNGDIFVDLGKTKGLLKIEDQSTIEHYEVDDTIKAVVIEVKGEEMGFNKKRRKDDLNSKNIQVFLSRISPELVKELLTMEVPEINDGSIEIKKIVREPGYKTKIAVYSDLVDPVSSCIGPHGTRITNVVKELGGEKIDIIRYSHEPKEFVKNAMTPARVDRIIIEDENSKVVFAVVDIDQLAYAYGKQKKNVILAARLTGWKINVKTENEITEENIESAGVKHLKNIFMEGTPLSELTDLSEELINILSQGNVNSVEELIELDENNAYDKIEQLTKENIKEIKKIIFENVEVEEFSSEEPTDDYSSDEEIECPHCEAKFNLSDIDLKSPKCPICAKVLEIEIEE